MTEQEMTKEQRLQAVRLFDEYTGKKRFNEFRKCPTADSSQDKQEASQEERKEQE